jgi:hypothetical protein
MRKRETREKVSVERVKTSTTKKLRPRLQKDYFAGAPPLPEDFPKRLRDLRPERIKPF